MKPFTVLLLYPDYLADTFGHDTYLAFVEAPSAREAELKAQSEASAQMGLDSIPDPYDFHVLATFAGHHSNLKENT